MSLDVDSRQPIRGPGARKALVEAILDAPPTAQETDWVEWKSQAALDEKAWQGELATHVLGFANREPTRARRSVGGRAYLVVGAEPGNLGGVGLFDSADLESWISRYTGGSEGPPWEPYYATVHEKHVLVIEVGAPRVGDRIFPLRGTFQDQAGRTITEGTVFIRRPGKTDRARAADFDMLNQRSAADPRAGLDLTLTWQDRPGVIRPLDLSGSARAAWLEGERERLLWPLNRHALATTAALDRALMMGRGETRSEERYHAQVEEYLTDAEPALAQEARARAVVAGLDRMRLAIRNNTEDNFEQVAVELYVPGEVMAFFDADDASELSNFPRPPSLWGKQGPLDPVLKSLASPVRPPTPRPARGTIDNAASARISFAPLHVRPDHSHGLPQVHLIVSPEHAGETITASWHATSTSVSGSDSGELEIEIAEEPITLGEVMPADAANG